MTRDELVRKLRDLRRLERRFAGDEAGARSPLWDEFFSLQEGARVRHPFRVLLVFDRPSRPTRPNRMCAPRSGGLRSSFIPISEARRR